MLYSCCKDPDCKDGDCKVTGKYIQSFAKDVVRKERKFPLVEIMREITSFLLWDCAAIC